MIKDENRYKSYNQLVDDAAAAIESPADSYAKYTAAYNLGRTASGRLADVEAELFGSLPRKYRKQEAVYNSRLPVVRLFHRDEKAAIEKTLTELNNLEPVRQAAKEASDSAAVYTGNTVAAAAEHYNQNAEAYQREALADDAAANVDINIAPLGHQDLLLIPSSQSSPKFPQAGRLK